MSTLAEDGQSGEPVEPTEGVVNIGGLQVPEGVLRELRNALAHNRPKIDQQITGPLRESVNETDIATVALVLAMRSQDDASTPESRPRNRVTDRTIAQWASLAVAASAYRREPDQVRGLIEQDPGARDVVATSHRLEVVKEFRRLLKDAEYFDTRVKLVKKPEVVWQRFLEDNQWILGGSLSLQFLHAWNEERLEQTVVGFSVKGEGKRSDALLRTAGLVRSLVFVEIKHHRTELLAKRWYRPGIWGPSKELSGGVAQVQGTVQKAAIDIGNRLQEKNRDGSDVPGGFSYLLRPRSYLIAGTLEDLHGEGGGLNGDKFQSFELYRRHIQEPEIVTFDELLARAEALVEALNA